MSWLAVLTALAPENVLLAGIVVLIVMEIVTSKAHSSLAVSLVAVSPNVVVVNQTLAEHAWPGQDAIGKAMKEVAALKEKFSAIVCTPIVQLSQLTSENMPFTALGC